jgi:hypothetical protein
MKTKDKPEWFYFILFYFIFEVPNIWPGFQIFFLKIIMHFFTLTSSYFYDSIIYN